MAQKKDKVSPEIAIAIASALGRYLKDDKLAFHIVAIKQVQHSEINLWALAGRQDNMARVR
ncbi:MAG TPA: hypothetical protein VMF29_02575 [Candidatus Edwardsbacteria bacterium]|nr:hypothetical protein [Candidatus Edwardsbacteria bacterium]